MILSSQGYNEFEDSDVQSIDIDLELLEEVAKRVRSSFSLIVVIKMLNE